MKKAVYSGKTKEQLMDALKEQKALIVKNQMTFGAKPSSAHPRKEVARIETALRMLENKAL